MIIDKINKPPIGEIIISFSKRNHLFHIEFPSTVKQSDIGNKTYFPTYKEALDRINEIHSDLLTATYLIKKVILVHLRTSVSLNTETQYGDFQGKPFTRTNHNHLEDAEGFQIEWFVCEVYQYPKAIKYKVIEANRNNKRMVSDRIDIRPQLISVSGDLREVDYREDLHQFLLDLDKSITEMVKKLDSFFDLDPQKFLQNFEANKLPKLLGENPRQNTQKEICDACGSYYKNGCWYFTHNRIDECPKQ